MQHHSTVPLLSLSFFRPLREIYWSNTSYSAMLDPLGVVQAHARISELTRHTVDHARVLR